MSLNFTSDQKCFLQFTLKTKTPKESTEQELHIKLGTICVKQGVQKQIQNPPQVKKESGEIIAEWVKIAKVTSRINDQ